MTEGRIEASMKPLMVPEPLPVGTFPGIVIKRLVKATSHMSQTHGQALKSVMSFPVEGRNAYFEKETSLFSSDSLPSRNRFAQSPTSLLGSLLKTSCSERH